MTCLVYNDLMQPFQVDYKPAQPRDVDRLFLKRAPKPEFKPVPSESVNGFTFSVEELPIFPKTHLDVNFKALQYWLDHLGPALYNPIKAIRLPDGTVIPDFDGGHRTRALWEIGEPTIRCIVKTGENIRSVHWHNYYESHTENNYPTARKHFSADPTIRMRQFYPHILPFPELLARFCEGSEDGFVLKDYLDTDASFADIISRTKQADFRNRIFDAISGTSDLKGKSVIDIGCSWGWASLLAWEQGAKKVLGLDINKTLVSVLNYIAHHRVAPEDGRINGEASRFAHLVRMDQTSTWDIVFFLNSFHHILNGYGKQAWDTMKSLLPRCRTVYVMTRRFNNVYESDRPIKDFEAVLGQKPKHLFTWSDREFFILKGGLWIH